MKTRKKKQRTKKKGEPVRDTTVVVAVGCGGIFYHGLTRMATFCNRRLKTRVVLVDPDKIEAKNASRQWGTKVGVEKVLAARDTLLSLTGDHIIILVRRVDAPRDLVAMVREDEKVMAFTLNGELKGGMQRPYWESVVRVVVVCSPDNHLCRVNVHKGCGLLASETGVEVCEITAGNGPDYGYAYGCVHQLMPVSNSKSGVPPDVRGIAKVFEGMGTTPGTVRCERDWTKYHPDIVSEARAEARRLRHPASCGAMKETVPGQTMTTNQLTAMCMWDLAEMMVGSDKVGEVYWTREKDPRVEGNMISVVRAKLVERE